MVHFSVVWLSLFQVHQVCKVKTCTAKISMTVCPRKSCLDLHFWDHECCIVYAHSHLATLTVSQHLLHMLIQMQSHRKSILQQKMFSRNFYPLLFSLVHCRAKCSGKSPPPGEAPNSATLLVDPGPNIDEYSVSQENPTN